MIKRIVLLLVAVATVFLLASCSTFALGAGYSSNNYEVNTDYSTYNVNNCSVSYTHTAVLFNVNEKDSGFHLYHSDYIGVFKIKSSYFNWFSSIGPAWILNIDDRIGVLAGAGLSLGISIPEPGYNGDTITRFGLEALAEVRYKIKGNYFIGLKGTFIFNSPSGQSPDSSTAKITKDICYGISLLYGW